MTTLSPKSTTYTAFIFRFLGHGFSIALCKEVTTAGVGVGVEGGVEENKRDFILSFIL